MKIKKLKDEILKEIEKKSKLNIKLSDANVAALKDYLHQVFVERGQRYAKLCFEPYLDGNRIFHYPEGDTLAIPKSQYYSAKKFLEDNGFRIDNTPNEKQLKEYIGVSFVICLYNL